MFCITKPFWRELSISAKLHPLQVGGSNEVYICMVVGGVYRNGTRSCAVRISSCPVRACTCEHIHMYVQVHAHRPSRQDIFHIFASLVRPCPHRPFLTCLPSVLSPAAARLCLFARRFPPVLQVFFRARSACMQFCMSLYFLLHTCTHIVIRFIG